MAAPLTDQFGPDVVHRIAATLPVDRPVFVEACLDGFDDLGLMDRARHIAQVMHDLLDDDPATAVEQVHASFGTQRHTGMAGFYYNPHAMFLERYGLPAYEESMAAMYDLTKLFTAEFCIRPFITAHPQTLDRLRQWTQDEDEHVRRLVSEGTRPRLPWAKRLPAFIADPAPVIDLLDLLKDDVSDYVLRSVGNSLNDISKDHPQRAIEVARSWADGRPALVRRGLRTLVAAGDPQALEVLGYGPGAATARADLPVELRIGDSLPLRVQLIGHGRVLVDVVVHFVKADGSTRRKVFKGAELDLEGAATLQRTISFAQLSTRRVHPGRHRIGVLVNGREQDLGSVDVRPCGDSPA